jgi:hypothetical protein
LTVDWTTAAVLAGPVDAARWHAVYLCDHLIPHDPSWGRRVHVRDDEADLGVDDMLRNIDVLGDAVLPRL